MSKRSFGSTGGFNKSTRMVGGRKLTYRPSAPLPGSYRARVSMAAAARYGRRGSKELKGVDTIINSVGVISNTLTSGAAIVPLNLVAPGSGSFNRIGRKISCKNVRIRGSFFITASQAALVQLSDVVRMTVVWDKQSSGAAAINWNTVFQYTPQSGTESEALYSGLKYDNMERFVILRDCTVPVIVQNTSSTVGSNLQAYVPFDEFIDLKGMETTFGAQTATAVVTDINTGVLYVMFRTENGTAALSANTVARLRFHDS